MHLLIWIWLGVALAAFIASLLVTAPYGRHTKSTWGPTLNQRWAWFIMEAPSPLILSLLFWTGTAGYNSYALAFWALWGLHYTNRSIIFPLRQRDANKRMPLVIALSAIFFNLVNAGLNGWYLGHAGDWYPEGWWADPRCVAGGLLFAAGAWVNIWSDNILLGLRKPGETHYAIPQGGLFRYVSCPNLMGEMVQWAGFALMTWNAAALSFAIWTVANLAPRALSHHRWYRQRFPDYPPQRKAFLPGIL